jgi:DNA-binding MurR/RpiR family transcriptional regulator
MTHIEELAQPPSPGAGQAWLSELLSNSQLTPKGQIVAAFVSSNPRTASFVSASELAARTAVNVATVVRFAQRLGFSGWREFQLHFRHRYLGSLMQTEVISTLPPDGEASPIQAALQRDIDNLHDTLTTLDLAEAETVARTIAKARRTLVVSSGTYSSVGLVLAHLASFMGYNVEFESRGGAHLVVALSHLEPGDCVVAISFWRVVKQVMLAAKHSRESGVTTVAITDSAFSPLAKNADHVLVVPTESSLFFQSMTAPMSLVYGLLAHLYALGGGKAKETIRNEERLWRDLDIVVE